MALPVERRIDQGGTAESEQTRDDLPERGYAMVFPVAMLMKIMFAQLLL